MAEEQKLPERPAEASGSAEVAEGAEGGEKLSKKAYALSQASIDSRLNYM